MTLEYSDSLQVTLLPLLCLAVGNHRHPKSLRTVQAQSQTSEGFHSLHQCMVEACLRQVWLLCPGGFVFPELVESFLSSIHHILLWAVLQCHYTSREKLLLPEYFESATSCLHLSPLSFCIRGGRGQLSPLISSMPSEPLISCWWAQNG